MRRPRWDGSGWLATGVVFGYAPGRPILHGVTIAIQPGEHVALVGRTGAGKSSALSLLGGLYEPWEGRVSILGREPRALPPAERVACSAWCRRRCCCSAGPSSRTWPCSTEDVSREMVERAVELRRGDTFVQALPDGYETPLAGVGGGSGRAPLGGADGAAGAGTGAGAGTRR